MKGTCVVICILLGIQVFSQNDYKINYLSDKNLAFDGLADQLVYDSTVYLYTFEEGFKKFYYSFNVITKELKPLKLVERIEFLDDYVIVDGMLSDSMLNPLFEEEYYKVFAQVGKSILVIDDDKYQLVNKQGEKRVLAPIGDYRIDYHKNLVLVYNEKSRKSKIYDDEGFLIKQDLKVFSPLFRNKYLVRSIGGKKLMTEDFYDLDGSKIAKDIVSSIFFEKNAILQNSRGKILYIKKNKIVDYNYDLKNFTTLNQLFFAFTDSKGQKGVMSSDFQVLIEPKYRFVYLRANKWLIGITKSDNVDVYEIPSEKSKLRLEDFNDPIYQKVWENAFFPILKKVEFPNIHFYVLFLNLKRDGIILTTDWEEIMTFTGQVKNNPKFQNPSHYMNLPYPLEIIDLYTKTASSEDEFFPISYPSNGYNICDMNKKVVLPRNFKIVRRLSKDIFLIGDNIKEIKLIQIESSGK